MDFKAFVQGVIGPLAMGTEQVTSAPASASSTALVSATNIATASTFATSKVGLVCADSCVCLVASFVWALVTFVPPFTTVEALALHLISIQCHFLGGA